MKENKELEWKEGFHISSKGVRKSLAEIDTKYLGNIINKYRKEGHDVSALEEELNKRP